MLKRCFDLAVAGCLLIALGPVMIAASLLILVGSGRPILYRGTRVGLGGQRFQIFKYRTMVVDAEALGGTTTGASDRRVTRLGAILRRTKIDELPQLLNVIRGEMSLVGPRPEVPEYADEYDGEERIILSVRPGITDSASLMFIDLQSHVGSEDPDRLYRERVLPIKNRYRVEYVKNQSFGGDLRILAQTASHLLGHLLGMAARGFGRSR